MLRYILVRLVSAVPVLIGISVITFTLVHVTAGSYVPGLQLSPNLTPEDVARIRADLGLDRPLWVQYMDWLGFAAVLQRVGLADALGGAQNVSTGLIEGDFGRSLLDGTPVLSDILERIPDTLELTTAAIVVGILLAIPLGVVAALRRGTALDTGLTVVSVVGFAIPQFWLGLLLILMFSVTLHAWALPSLPSNGSTSPVGGGGPLDRLAHLVMPAAVLAFFYLSVWSRFVRSTMIEVLTQDYIRTARAKGVAQHRVLLVHALRNALAPLVTLIGLELPGLFSGALVLEVVFGWPGVGRLAYSSALAYDFPLVLGTTTFVAILVILGNLVADLLYAVADPRVRYG